MPIISKWCENPVSDYGIVTGCDNKYEWMLPWWHKCITKTNTYPIAFADFGLSPQMRNWCAAHGTLIDLNGSLRKRNWFKKPFAVLNAPFKNIIWMDSDCEVRKSLAPLFEFSTSFGVTLDPHTPWVKTKGAVASGVVVTYHGNPLVVDWANACLRDSALRGDQEVLNSILVNQRDKISIMPATYQWLRLDGENSNAIIMHWTGSKGKAKIKQFMGGGVVVAQKPKVIIKPKAVVRPIVRRTSMREPLPATIRNRRFKQK